jgi:hypothetical protein
VLEDDLDLHPGFLDFHLQCLKKYASEDRVMQVSGYRYIAPDAENRVTLLPLTSTWGWSTWQRAWRRFDPSASGWPADRNDPRRRAFDFGDAYPYSAMLDGRLAGHNQSWGILWYWNVVCAGGLVAFPPKSLLENRGFDGSGTHCENATDENSLAQVASEISSWNASWDSHLIWPASVETNPEDYGKVRDEFMVMASRA